VMLLTYCVVVEVRCNWYHRDINIFVLSKNLKKHRIYLDLLVSMIALEHGKAINQCAVTC
jgi:hypothetical protein